MSNRTRGNAEIELIKKGLRDMRGKELRELRSAVVRAACEKWSETIKVTDEPLPDVKYSVYVIELKQAVWECRRCASRLDGVEPGSSAFYIGSTGRPAAMRVAQHIAGYKSSHMAREHFKRRAHELEPHVNKRISWDSRLERGDAKYLELELLPELFRFLGYAAHAA